ncbi:hypothetical protein AFIC_001202 [[Pseudomonas] carboxydohydrogena]|uniref:Uncharacterized protein n=1 Tax=Afipia carboxydohydrogena TaxID=290 RepID=A0ABY8BSW9_AFICR|nr:hypothetical protein AFIC_001202 [[Pseudomonas] carboxydohydrogena]
MTSICENRSFIASEDDVEAFVAEGDCAASSAFHVSGDKAPLCPQFEAAEDVADADVLDEMLKGFEFWVTPVVVFADDDFDDVSDDNRSSAVDAAPAKARYMAILPPPRMRGPTGVPAIVVPDQNARKIDIFGQDGAA